MLSYGLASDAGRRRLVNEDAACVDARRGLFVVCDGIGGQPSGEAASNLACRALGHELVRRLRGHASLDQRTLKQLLIESATRVSADMRRLSAGQPALGGMGCTLVALLVDARAAFVLHAGDSRAYLLRAGELRRLTTDHTRMIDRRLVPGAAEEEHGERRLLVEYVGSSKPLCPDATVVPLRPGDRLLLCSDGLTDPVPDAELAAILGRHPDPGAATTALVDAANAAGGPDNVTAVVVDYGGERALRPADRTPPERTPERPGRGVAARFHEALRAIEVDLEALAADAAAVAVDDPLAALAAARKRLGEPLYRARLEADDTLADRPAAALHAARADPAGDWRRRYEAHLDALAPPLELITAGSVRLSPLLHGDDTAELYRRLWLQWRGVERRYFHAFRPGAPPPGVDPQIAVMLTAHLHQAVRTMRELLEFLPKFLRSAG